MDLARLARGIVVEHPGRVTPTVVRLAARHVGPLLRLCHRPTLEGVENLPDGPFLLVANHSAGLGISEILCFAVEYLRLVGPGRPLAGFAHPVGFRVFPLSAALASVGAIPSGYEAARKALAAGVPLLVFPGGDHETLRPIWQTHLVDFGGRVGFLRIARQAGVPIVPLGIRGAHLTAPVLIRSSWLATLLVVPRLIGTKRWGLSLLGLLGAIAIALFLPVSWPLRAFAIWAWLGSALVFLPVIPWTIRMRIGPPIPASELFPSGTSGVADGSSGTSGVADGSSGTSGVADGSSGTSGGTDEDLRSALARVQAAVQSLVDR